MSNSSDITQYFGGERLNIPSVDGFVVERPLSQKLKEGVSDHETVVVEVKQYMSCRIAYGRTVRDWVKADRVTVFKTRREAMRNSAMLADPRSRVIPLSQMVIEADMLARSS